MLRKRFVWLVMSSLRDYNSETPTPHNLELRAGRKIVMEASNGKVSEKMPKTEVVAKAKHRRFTAEYKLRILRELDALKGSGETGALLRREGLYSSHLTTWRQQRERGELDGLAPQKRGPKVDLQAIELARLQRENERLRERLRQAELIIDVQKKVAQMLGVPIEETQSGRAELIHSTEQLAETIGVVEACQALDLPRSSLYRARQPGLAVCQCPCSRHEPLARREGGRAPGARQSTVSRPGSTGSLCHPDR